MAFPMTYFAYLCTATELDCRETEVLPSIILKYKRFFAPQCYPNKTVLYYLLYPSILYNASLLHSGRF